MWLQGLLKHQYVICLPSHAPEPPHEVCMTPPEPFFPSLPADTGSCWFGGSNFIKAQPHSAKELFFWMFRKMSSLWKGGEERRRRRANKTEEKVSLHQSFRHNKSPPIPVSEQPVTVRWEASLQRPSPTSSCNQKRSFSGHCGVAYLHVGKTQALAAWRVWSLLSLIWLSLLILGYGCINSMY